MARSKKRRRFEIEEVLRHLAVHHPRCPDAIAALLAQRVADRTWRAPLKLGQAIGIMISTYIRHVMTDYEDLMDVHGLSREEARIAVAPELQGILEAWGPSR